MGQTSSDGNPQPELDLTLDAVDIVVDPQRDSASLTAEIDAIVPELREIVQQQRDTKSQLRAQIAKCQRQLDKLQEVSDAGTLLLEYLGVHIRTSDRRVRSLSEALVKGDDSLTLKDLLGVDPNGNQKSFSREEKVRFKHINGGSEGLAVRSVAAASVTCQRARTAFGPGLSAWGVARLYGSTLMFEKALGNPSIHKGPHLFFARASLASKDPIVRRAAQCLVPRLAKAATAVFGEACTCCRANAAAFLWSLFKATHYSKDTSDISERAHQAAGLATIALAELLTDEGDEAPWTRLWSDFAEALLPSDPKTDCMYRLAAEYGRPGGVWCAEALAGLSGAVVRSSVMHGHNGPTGKGLEALLLFLSKALLLDDEEPGSSDDEDDEAPLTRTRGFGQHKSMDAREMAATCLRVLFERPGFAGVNEARRAGAPHALAQAINLAHQEERPALVACGKALVAFASFDVNSAGRAAAEIARCCKDDVVRGTLFACVTETAIKDDGIVPKPARILANLVTLSPARDVDALGRRFVDTLGDAAEKLRDENKKVDRFAVAVAHSGLFPALQLLTVHDDVSWGVFVDALAQMLSFVQFTLDDVDPRDLNLCRYILEVTKFLERSSDKRRCSTLIAGVAALAEVYPPPQDAPLELWHAWSLLCNAALTKASSPAASKFTVFSSVDVLLRLSWRACVGPPLLQVPRLDPRLSGLLVQLLRDKEPFAVPKDWVDWTIVGEEIDGEVSVGYAVEVRDVASIILYAQLRSWPEERVPCPDHDPLPCTYEGARGWLKLLSEPKPVDALYALLREQRPASAECAYRMLEALSTNDDNDEPLSHAVGRVVYARELRKLGKVASCDVTFDSMLRAALESGLPVCVLEKVRGAWDEAREVRERVASRRGPRAASSTALVVDAKKTEDALRAEAELLSLLDEEDGKATAKASKASKKKAKKKKKKKAVAVEVVQVSETAPPSDSDDSDGEALLRLARPEPVEVVADPPAPARRKRKGKKASIVVELPPAPAKAPPAKERPPAAPPAKERPLAAPAPARPSRHAPASVLTAFLAPLGLARLAPTFEKDDIADVACLKLLTARDFFLLGVSANDARKILAALAGAQAPPVVAKPAAPPVAVAKPPAVPPALGGFAPQKPVAESAPAPLNTAIGPPSIIGPAAARLNGVVAWYTPSKKHGFLKPDNGGPDVFVHGADCQSALEKGDRVTFGVVPYKGRSKAIDVTRDRAPFGFAAPPGARSPFGFSMEPAAAAPQHPFGFGVGREAAPGAATGFASSLFSSTPAPSPPPAREPRADECPVCFGTTRECALVPCGHLLCDACAGVYDDGNHSCPVCRTPVERVMKVYF